MCVIFNLKKYIKSICAFFDIKKKNWKRNRHVNILHLLCTNTTTSSSSPSHSCGSSISSIHTQQKENQTQANPITTTVPSNLQKIKKPKKIQNLQRPQINFLEIWILNLFSTPQPHSPPPAPPHLSMPPPIIIFTYSNPATSSTSTIINNITGFFSLSNHSIFHYFFLSFVSILQIYIALPRANPIPDEANPNKTTKNIILLHKILFNFIKLR